MLLSYNIPPLINQSDQLPSPPVPIGFSFLTSAHPSSSSTPQCVTISRSPTTDPPNLFFRRNPSEVTGVADSQQRTNSSARYHSPLYPYLLPWCIPHGLVAVGTGTPVDHPPITHGMWIGRTSQCLLNPSAVHSSQVRSNCNAGTHALRLFYCCSTLRHSVHLLIREPQWSLAAVVISSPYPPHPRPNPPSSKLGPIFIHQLYSAETLPLFLSQQQTFCPVAVPS